MAENQPWKPAPEPAGLTDVARSLTLLSQLIPPGEWMTYGDLAEAANTAFPTAKRTAARGVASALSYLPEETPVQDWPIPWHRIRDENGHLIYRGRGVQTDPLDPLNQLFAAEGGQLSSGAARQGRRFPMAAKLRTGQISITG